MIGAVHALTEANAAVASKQMPPKNVVKWMVFFVAFTSGNVEFN
jgi:hypothetical protein